MKRILFILPLLLFAGLAVAVAVPLLRGEDPSVLPSTLIDQPVPDFALPPLPGMESGLSADDLGGKPMLVNFFASWCVPCLAEHPLLTRLTEEEGVTIHGVNYNDDPADALAWLDRHGNPYDLIGADREGRVAIDWGVYGVPETFVVDTQGRIRYRHAGPITPDVLERELMPLLTELSE
ncbi:DsbE family thiol:disulfide interchange protein [Inquilinus sp. CAU 1745]|uniref:DsbE family thiol:disulfide interchange protein n=1 Tax=Inquilinus sp. CAU 1745 TaxID=3140369 RepID=UPI00325BA217